MTTHAQVRCQQRGITEKLLKLVLIYGTYSAQKDGAFIARMDKKSISNFCKKESKKSLIDKVKNICIVIEDGAIVTVFHQTKKINFI